MSEGVLLCEITLGEVAEAWPCRILDANPAFERGTGLELARIRGLDPVAALPPLAGCIRRALECRAQSGDQSVGEVFVANLGRCFEVRSFWPHADQLALLFNDVTERWRAAQGRRWRDGELDGLVQEPTWGLETAIDQLNREITERKQAEAKLRAREEELRLVAEYTYDWETWLSPEGRFIYVSPSCERMTGYPPQAFKDDPGLMELIVHPEDHSAFLEHMIVGSGENPPCGVEFRILRADGGTRWISHYCQPVYASDGSYLGRRACNRDISDLKRRELMHAARLELLEQVAAKRSLGQCCKTLLEHVMAVFPGHAAAILGLDPFTGRLRLLEAHGLPDFYTEAMDGLEARPEVDAWDTDCWRELVVHDLEQHPRWAPYRELTRRAGLGACWSGPVLASGGNRTLGTFVVYARVPGKPSAEDLGLMQEAARLAGMAITIIGHESMVRKLSTAVGASPNGMLITDTEGNIEYVNPRFTEITGYAFEEALGQNPRLLQSGLTPPAVYEEMWATLQGGGFWRGELRNRRKDGELYWQKLSIAPIRDAGGNIRNMVGITEDVSERRRLEEIRMQLEAAVSQSMDSVIIQSVEDQILFANPTFYRTLGLSAEEAAGRDLLSLLRESGAGASLAGALEEARAGRAWKGHLLVLGPSDARIELDGGIFPVRDLEGRVSTLLGIFRDVTKEVEADRHLRQVQKMDALGALAGGIVHDFNNILSVILAASEIMEWQLDEGSPARSKLEVIYQAARRAQELNKQILTFSRKSEDKQIPFDLSGVAKEATTLLRTTLPVNITFHAEIASSVWVSGDPGQISQVLMNLAINGYHAMKEQGGRLDLSLGEVELGRGNGDQPPSGLGEGRFALLTVRDTGCGMGPEVLEKIFEPFFTTKPKGEGTGLGLAVVDSIVHKHGGSIQVSSELGKGTSFQVFLPCALPGALPLTRDPQEELAGSERILLVEDEDIVAALAKQGLQSMGYSVTAKTSALDALEVFQAKPDDFDLLVTDFSMPELSGAELTKRLRTIRPGLPAILLSGSFNLPDAALGFSVSFDEILAKPMATKELARAIRRTVECHRLQPPPAGLPENAMAVAAPGDRLPTILCAVENAATRAQLRSWLAKGGHRVREARDGQAAWEIFNAAEDPSIFSLIITDIPMPRMDGLELTEKVRRKDPQIPIMILTDTEDVEVLKKAITLHVSEFLQKPFASKELLDRVNRLAADRRNEMQVQRLSKTAQAVRLAQKRMEAMPEQDLPVYSICEPLTEAGGDVFRCIRRPDGSVVLILADVAGHSIASSYAVASFLGMLSTFVQEWWGVKDLFHRLNQNILMGPFPESPIAVLAAHWHPETGRMHVINAGIPYGVWHRKSLDRTEPIVLNGLPLGLLDDPLVEERVLVLEEGDRVLFGTDGLFDTCSPDRVYFRDRVPLHWEGAVGLPIEQALGGLCDAVKTHGNGKILDDLLVVGLEQSPWSPTPQELLRVFPSTAASLEGAERALGALLAAHPQWRGLEASRRFDLFLALREAMNNAIEHGNGGDAERRIVLGCRLTEDALLVRVVDEGSGFDLDGTVSPEDALSERGRGLAILRSTTHNLRMRGGELEFHFDLRGAAYVIHA